MKARLGQNFLVSPTAPRAIVAAAGSLADRTVVEIGPGRGAITALLARSARRLVAVEFDRALADQLIITYAQQDPPVDIITNDILRVDLGRLSARENAGLTIIGNLPYYITSDILLHLFAHASVIDRAVLMMQREVADRVCAQPGSRDYGLLTVTTQLFARIDRLFDLAPSDFSPPPQVYSSVVRLDFCPRAAELGMDANAFQQFLRVCFAQKRKTLGNNLRAAGYTPTELADACTEAHLSLEARAEALSLEQLAALFRNLQP